jgi:hypothetical protein
MDASQGVYDKILATARRNSGEDEIKALETTAAHAKGGWEVALMV